MHEDDFTQGITLPSNDHSHEVEHEDEDHHDHEEEHGEVFSALSSWNTALCSSLLVIIITISTLFNSMNAATLIRKKSSSSNSSIMLLSSCMSLVAYAVLLPITLAGVASPESVITETYCYVQESLTLGVVLLGFFLPSLTCLNRMIVVNTGVRNWCKLRHILCILFGFLSVVIVSILIPLLAITEEGAAIHEHGCHLWSVRVDPAMWYRVYTILVALGLCILTMALSYVQIYRKVVASINSISNHAESGLPAASFTASVAVNSSEAGLNPPTHSNRMTSWQDSANTIKTRDVSHAKTRFYRHRQVAKIASIMISVYVAIWIPWSVISWISVGSSDKSISHELRVTTMVIGYIPAAVDPVLNVFMSPILKAEMKKRVNEWMK